MESVGTYGNKADSPKKETLLAEEIPPSIYLKNAFLDCFKFQTFGLTQSQHFHQSIEHPLHGFFCVLLEPIHALHENQLHLHK